MSDLQFAVLVAGAYGMPAACLFLYWINKRP